MTAAVAGTFDAQDLENKVKAMYRNVAEDPHGAFHFEMGRALAERLGYAQADLDRIPADPALAQTQWEAYVDVFRSRGWDVIEVAPRTATPTGSSSRMPWWSSTTWPSCAVPGRSRGAVRRPP